MIYHYLEALNAKRIILASSSARRKEILDTLGLKFEILVPKFAENLNQDSFEHPKDYVVATATAKADEVRKRLSSQDQVGGAPDLIVACDTCVTLDGKIYGKPIDDDHAAQMLTMWSGRTQEVISGVCLTHRLSADRQWRSNTFSETTSVKFHTLQQDAIAAYVRSGEPRGKAGAYGIQGPGGAMIEGIVGDYYNVVGFPLHHFCKVLLPLLQSSE
ncbi:probable bifunctional dTTP/UTP pyrophosphatase/methyltransferase protein [Hyalella azteca]|uniref:Probable bifunctional dTTP/UTP pyrophosphatase/methyltransferase protein n=1 Tax=Hyalella azteca TaxID=294128 RepID=A0A8B7ND50_HYAAZ|nr:probable bifunctional dTTP/UTP pyrophosphatase/methyltransferase protein [Hyalella azteca]